MFKRTNINEYLLKAMERGTILTGLSAGAMIYFRAGLSDANRSTNIENPLSYLNKLLNNYKDLKMLYFLIIIY